MSPLLESIQIREGLMQNMSYHEERMSLSSLALYGTKVNFSLGSLILPLNAREGIVKCRIIYRNVVDKIEFQPYLPKEVNSLKLVFSDNIAYKYKFEDRSGLLGLLKQKESADDILIVKQGRITDTSFSNVVFRKGANYLTPSTCLLNGTRRQQLLNEGLIKEMDMSVEDISRMDSCILINAMLDLKSENEIKISSIIF